MIPDLSESILKIKGKRMDPITIAVIVFMVLETSNIIMLYFIPGTRKGNGVGVFDAFETSDKDPEIRLFVMYLINWVAGTKVIFISLLAVILIWGNEETKIAAVSALILSIMTFFWRLYPLILRMDRKGYITPKGYGKTLGIMISLFIAILSSALILQILL